MAGPPAGVKMGRLFTQVTTRGRLPHATVDFPRYCEDGTAAARVYMRPLTQRDLDLCRANAAAYVAEILRTEKDIKWRPEELEDNATASEILAVACRDPEDPDKPFFECGVVETRMCTTEELAMLFSSYNAIREKSYPTLAEMSEADMWAWVKALEEGASEFPFSRISRARLEAFCLWAARSLTILLRLVSGTPSSNSQPSPSTESDADD